MKKLTLPDIDDEEKWRDLAANLQIADNVLLAASTTNVVARYEDYHAADGDLSGFTTVSWSAALEPRLSALYSQPPAALAYLADIRKKASASVCPMCGSAHTHSLDHVLPKTDFPEFFIYSRNLVPACPCNSLRKANYKGALPGQRVLHPYYDNVLKRRLVRARIRGPFPRAKLSILVCVRQGRSAAAVRYHIEHTLEKMNVLDHWSELWVALLRRPADVLRISGRGLTKAAVKNAVLATRNSADAECGTPNNWRSMFYSGLLNSSPAVDYLTDHLNGIFAGTINPETI